MKNGLFTIFIVLLMALTITTNNFTQISQAENDKPGIYDVRYSPDGKRLAVVIETGILIFNTQTDDKPEVFTEDVGRPWRVAFSQDGKTLISVNSFGTIQMRDSKTKKHLRTLNNFPPQRTRYVKLGPDGSAIAYIHEDKTVSLWDAKTEQRLQTFKGHTDDVFSVELSSDGKWLATGSYDGTVLLWNVNTEKHFQILSGHWGTVQSIAFSPDGKHVLTGDMRNTIRLWDVKTGELIRTFSDQLTEDIWMGDINSVVFSPDGKLIAGAGGFSSHLWDAKTGEHLQVLSGPRTSHTGHGGPWVLFSPDPDDRVVASACLGEIQLWNLDTGKLVRTFSTDF